MIELMPLAHGALGILDELLPVLIVGIPAVLLGAAVFFARLRGDKDKLADSIAADSRLDSEQTRPDHFNLD